jgi:uroporphyrin-III C-methyltransferase
MKEKSLNADRPLVFIVGAGPGASDLMTLKGMRVLRRADIIFYDALVNPEILQQAGRRAEKVFVGKRCGQRAMEQPEVSRRIVEAAKSGKTVVRLKGGDPLIFGRGGEEALACRRAGVRFEIVPGVSSAMGAASYAGIPLTHRGTASSVAFVTARNHHLSGKGKSLAEIAAAVDTLVIFMGGLQLHLIADSLTTGQLSGSTPVAVVSRATMPDQQTVLGVLENIEERVNAVGLHTPMLIIVGEVSNLSRALNWFEEQRQDRTLQALPCTGERNEIVGESRAV